MKIQTLKNALPIVMRSLADDVGVQVVWGADNAHTWNRVIYLPNLQEGEGVAKLALGYGTHESAHIIHSDQKVYEKAGEEPPIVVKLMNAMEDVRIEGLMFQKYPAVRPWLDHTVKVVLGGVDNSDGLPEAALLHNAALLNGRYRLLNQPLADEAAASLAAMRQVMGGGRAVKVMALLGKIPACPDTEAVYQLTHQILDVLDEEEPEDNDQQPDPQEQPQGGSQDQDNQPGGGGSQGQSQPGDGQGNAGDQQPGEQGAQQGDAGADGPGQGGKGQSKDDGKGDPDDSSQGNQSGDAGADQNGADGASGAGAGSGKPSLKQKVLAASASELDDLKSDLGEAAAKVLKAHASPSSGSTPAAVFHAPVGSELLGEDVAQKGRVASMGMRQVLMGLIQGSRNSRVVMRRTGRQVEGSRLARVAVGETRIFRKSEPVQRTNAAFQVLLDASGSMSKCVREAEAAVVAVLTSLEGLQGVTSGAMVFPRSGIDNAKTCVGVLKRHNQTLVRALKENRFGVLAGGGTPLADAIWPAAGDLLSAKGERKVLAVITDGDPDRVSAAEDMVARCRASGIDVFALAFGSARTELLDKVYGPGNWTFLSGVDQLRAGLSSLVQSVLTNAA